MNENTTDKKTINENEENAALMDAAEAVIESDAAQPTAPIIDTEVASTPEVGTEGQATADDLQDAQDAPAELTSPSLAEDMPTSEAKAEADTTAEVKPPRRRSKTAIVCGCICFLFFCCCAVLCCSMLVGNHSNENGGKTVIYKNDTWTNPGQEHASNALVNAVAKASPSVVAITTESVSYTVYGDYVSEGAGSGVIFTEDGYIITNHHVISGATNIQVTLENGDVHKATLIGTDSQTDLAVIKIDVKGLKPTTLAAPDSVMVGQTVLAIGNPLGTLSNTVTNGIVSSLARQLTVGEAKMTLLQHNAAVSPGNSGGGLFNVNGELIGIVNAKSSGEGVEGIGFAIPLQTINTVVPELIENGYVTGRPQLGITAYEILSYQTIYSVPTEIRRAYEGIQRPGIYINTDDAVQYAKDSDKLQMGDYLSAIDDQLIDEFVDISLYLAEKKAGQTVKLTVYRYDASNGKTAQINVSIVLTEKK